MVILHVKETEAIGSASSLTTTPVSRFVSLCMSSQKCPKFNAPRMAKPCIFILVGSMILGGQSLQMRQSGVSFNRQLYLEHQTIYTLKVKQGHMSKIHMRSNHIETQ